MVELLIHKYVKDYKNTNSIDVKSSVGKLLGIIGIFFNILLFVIKFLIGLLVHSVSIQADAINNLSDALSSIVSIVSFVISKQPADFKHPYGHERMDVISSLIVGILVFVFGFELFKSSIEVIFKPEEICFEYTTVLILVISICIKLYMYLYNNKYAKVYDSSLLEATALDSISDVKGTLAILLSTIISPLIHFNLDGYAGSIVSVLIMWNAWQLLKEMIDSLLGEAPDEEVKEKVEKMILDCPDFLGVHDVMIHSYGKKRFATAHVSVDSRYDLIPIHSIVDKKEREVKEKTGIELVIHMDPVKVDDPETNEYEKKLRDALSSHPDYQFHDFRVISDKNDISLIFDLVIPFEEIKSQEEIEEELMSKIQSDKQLHFIITIDHPI